MSGATIVLGSPPGLGAPTPSGGTGIPHDLVAFFLNADLLKVFERIGLLVFMVAPDGQPTLSPKARDGIAALLGADLKVPEQAAAVDVELAQALTAYSRYLTLSTEALPFTDQIRVLLRDLDAPNQPIP
jgi:hypothetical protein